MGQGPVANALPSGAVQKLHIHTGKPSFVHIVVRLSAVAHTFRVHRPMLPLGRLLNPGEPILPQMGHGLMKSLWKAHVMHHRWGSPEALHMLQICLTGQTEFHIPPPGFREVPGHAQAVWRVRIGVARIPEPGLLIDVDSCRVFPFDTDLHPSVLPFPAALGQEERQSGLSIAFALLFFVDQKLRQVVAGRLLVQILHQRQAHHTAAVINAPGACPMAAVGIGPGQNDGRRGYITALVRRDGQGGGSQKIGFCNGL